MNSDAGNGGLVTLRKQDETLSTLLLKLNDA